MCSYQPYLILGIGNSLLSDDGVGVHAANMLRDNPPPGAIVAAAETDFLCAVALIDGRDKILVIDAMDFGQAPGSIRFCGAGDIAGPGQIHSLHELGLLGALEFLDGPQHPEIHVLGIQPGRIGLGAQLSPEVAAALPKVVEAARRIVSEFGQ